MPITTSDVSGNVSGHLEKSTQRSEYMRGETQIKTKHKYIPNQNVTRPNS